jgi:polar amino acid transport system substrate-binding protein
MIRITRLFALLLALAALGLAGCGGDDGDDDAATNGAETTETTEEAAFETVNEGVLTVGSDIPFPPFEFREGDDLTGFDVELVEEIASRLGLEVEWVPTAFETIFTQLATGRFDMIASATTITDEREELINFTDPYYRAQQALIVNSEQTPDIQSTADVGEGDTIAVQRGTTGEAWARENLEPQGAEIRSFPQAPDTYIALETGNVQGVIFDEPSAVEEAANRESLEVVEAIDTDEDFGLGVNPENEALLEEVNRVLAEMIEDGGYQQIYDTWFPDAPAGSVADAS